MATIRLAILALIGALLLSGAPVPARAQGQGIDTAAPHAILIDYDSGTVLFEKAADDPFPPASLTKLMTAEYVFSALKKGDLTMDDTFTVSENAWRRGGAPAGGSAMFAAIHSTIAVHDLLRGLIVQSGNDAAIVFAEGIAGSEAAFADLMNRRATEIGMKGSVFRNSNGLPDPDQHVTARDLAVLARHIIASYPDYYPIFSEPSFTWNNITQRNRVPLMDAGIGVDGLKTGYIQASGYGIVSSAVSNGQRLILVASGLGSEREREAEARKILEWGFRSFSERTAFKADEVVAEASVYGGTVGRVPLKAAGPIEILVARSGSDELRARVVYQGPLLAPVTAGTQVGAFRVWNGDRLIQETPLFTAGDVGVGTLHQRAFDALSELALGWL